MAEHLWRKWLLHRKMRRKMIESRFNVSEKNDGCGEQMNQVVKTPMRADRTLGLGVPTTC
jgi:hypothetical protein